MENSGGIVENFNLFLKDLNCFEEVRDIKRLYLDFQRVRNQFKCFEECSLLTDFIKKLSSFTPLNFGIKLNNNYINSELYSLSILDDEYNLREEWRTYILKNTGETFLNKRFSKLIGLCMKIENDEGDYLGLKCYTYFRMDTLIRNPIITINDFKEGLAEILKDKYFIYKNKFVEIFKEFYEKIKVKAKYNICNNCGYWDDENRKHIFCNGSKFIEKELGVTSWIIKESVYKDYTSVGLIERDTFDRLIKEKFEAILYPNIEKDGDIKVIIGNNKIFIDCKTYLNINDLVNELAIEKYQNRVIVVPDIFFKEHKEYIDSQLPKHLSRRFLNIDSLIKYLNGERRKCNE